VFDINPDEIRALQGKTNPEVALTPPTSPPEVLDKDLKQKQEAMALSLHRLGEHFGGQANVPKEYAVDLANRLHDQRQQTGYFNPETLDSDVREYIAAIRRKQEKDHIYGSTAKLIDVEQGNAVDKKERAAIEFLSKGGMLQQDDVHKDGRDVTAYYRILAKNLAEGKHGFFSSLSHKYGKLDAQTLVQLSRGDFESIRERNPQLATELQQEAARLMSQDRLKGATFSSAGKVMDAIQLPVERGLAAQKSFLRAAGEEATRQGYEPHIPEQERTYIDPRSGEQKVTEDESFNLGGVPGKAFLNPKVLWEGLKEAPWGTYEHMQKNPRVQPEVFAEEQSQKYKRFSVQKALETMGPEAPKEQVVAKAEQIYQGITDNDFLVNSPNASHLIQSIAFDPLNVAYPANVVKVFDKGKKVAKILQKGKAAAAENTVFKQFMHDPELAKLEATEAGKVLASRTRAAEDFGGYETRHGLDDLKSILKEANKGLKEGDAKLLAHALERKIPISHLLDQPNGKQLKKSYELLQELTTKHWDYKQAHNLGHYYDETNRLVTSGKDPNFAYPRRAYDRPDAPESIRKEILDIYNPEFKKAPLDNAKDIKVRSAMERKGAPGYVEDPFLQWSIELDQLGKASGKNTQAKETLQALIDHDHIAIPSYNQYKSAHGARIDKQALDDVIAADKTNLGARVKKPSPTTDEASKATEKLLDYNEWKSQHIRALTEKHGVEFAEAPDELFKVFARHLRDPNRLDIYGNKLAPAKIGGGGSTMFIPKAHVELMTNALKSGEHPNKIYKSYMAFNNAIARPLQQIEKKLRIITRPGRIVEDIHGAIDFNILAHGIKGLDPGDAGKALKGAVLAALTDRAKTGSFKKLSKDLYDTPVTLSGGKEYKLGEIMETLERGGLFDMAQAKYDLNIAKNVSPDMPGWMQKVGGAIQGVDRAVDTGLKYTGLKAGAQLTDTFQHVLPAFKHLKSLDPDDVAKTLDFVSSYAGNYRRMSAAQRHVLRDAFTFYSWIEHATTRGMKSFLTHPQRMSHHEKTLQALNKEWGKNIPLDDEGLVDHQKMGIVAPPFLQDKQVREFMKNPEKIPDFGTREYNILVWQRPALFWLPYLNTIGKEGKYGVQTFMASLPKFLAEFTLGTDIDKVEESTRMDAIKRYKKKFTKRTEDNLDALTYLLWDNGLEEDAISLRLRNLAYFQMLNLNLRRANPAAGQHYRQKEAAEAFNKAMKKRD
jgi:hypothetical protein